MDERTTTQEARFSDEEIAAAEELLIVAASDCYHYPHPEMVKQFLTNLADLRERCAQEAAADTKADCPFNDRTTLVCAPEEPCPKCGQPGNDAEDMGLCIGVPANRIAKAIRTTALLKAS
jgi:hypothetical protein